MEYDEVCLNYFLEHQSQLFDENVKCGRQFRRGRSVFRGLYGGYL